MIRGQEDAGGRATSFSVLSQTSCGRTEGAGNKQPKTEKEDQQQGFGVSDPREEEEQEETSVPVASAKHPLIARSCNLCRKSHTACEAERPCPRCVRLGKAHLCSDIPLRKRGRPKVAREYPVSSTTNLVPIEPKPPPPILCLPSAYTHTPDPRLPEIIDELSTVDPKLASTSTSTSATHTGTPAAMRRPLPTLAPPHPVSYPNSGVPPWHPYSKSQLKVGDLLPDEGRITASTSSPAHSEDPSYERKRRGRETEGIGSDLQIYYGRASAKRSREEGDLFHRTYTESGQERSWSAMATSITPPVNRPLPSPVSMLPMTILGSYSYRPSWKEIYDTFPFLAYYRFHTDEFVVDDVRKPVTVVTRDTNDKVTPRIGWANRAFCALHGYSYGELLGCPISAISLVSATPELARAVGELLKRPRPAMSVSPIHEIRLRHRHKENTKAIMMDCRVQICHGPNGFPQYTIWMIDRWKDDFLKEWEREVQPYRPCRPSAPRPPATKPQH